MLSRCSWMHLILYFLTTELRFWPHGWRKTWKGFNQTNAQQRTINLTSHLSPDSLLSQLYTYWVQVPSLTQNDWETCGNLDQNNFSLTWIIPTRSLGTHTFWVNTRSDVILKLTSSNIDQKTQKKPRNFESNFDIFVDFESIFELFVITSFFVNGIWSHYYTNYDIGFIHLLFLIFPKLERFQFIIQTLENHFSKELENWKNIFPKISQ